MCIDKYPPLDGIHEQSPLNLSGCFFAGVTRVLQGKPKGTTSPFGVDMAKGVWHAADRENHKSWSSKQDEPPT